jgi:cytochrome c553
MRITKHRLCKIALLLIAFGVGGFLVAASGIIPVKASSGHWSITAWLLHFAMRRSVATHTLGLEAPPLDDSQLVLKGAGHYETGCRPCHGGPDLRPPRVAQAMTPHPPHLPPQIPRWSPEELFYVVKHGVKFTGMPAWPAQLRDDEVWAVVAFLRTLPDLTAGEYRQLVHGETPQHGQTAPIQGLAGVSPASRTVAANCDRCHGADGGGRGGSAFPKLAGQRPTYLFAALRAYAGGERHSGIMQPISAPLSLETMREIAQHYARLPAPVSAPPRQYPFTAIERGRLIASRGIPRQRVPACAACHGPSAAPRNPHYPLLAGQYADYLVLQLTLFQQRRRGGSAYAHLMSPVASRLTPGQMRDVALYYESLTSAQVRAAEGADP